MPNTAKEDKTIKEGQIIEALPSAMFRVLLDDGSEIIGHLAGKMRLHYIKVLVGDRVVMEFSPYDEKRGRIIRRL
ncbi:translation initiation factor IF-1 [Candidatus Giovannonibacteria bacterium RIFCSPHIGHO2_02_FULL_46_20]|uniref:Translation initiation factor IF-1 n=1 Tax=Candidatus Giovannonibacteria bacterium RIFCSPHIGHO2_02_FULL_46_20 TaxID=1798338 RepID=A0A1F5WDL4_9BACT|nr:MAG: translation initiation factor IF-1 [Candidatus Giovannonibacteria bacterium RIFCSPHIGHO2_02_FULL_46_20]